MTNSDPLRAYLHTLRQSLSTGAATEHTHRPALQALLEALAGGIKAINEPQRIACGAPDLLVTRDGLTAGYVETKDVGTSLDQTARTEQLRRYRRSLENLLLTDYVDFHWYVDGDLRESARLAKVQGGGVTVERGGRAEVETLLLSFLSHAPKQVGTPRELAERMARLAHLVRDIVVQTFETDRASDLLRGWRSAFAKVLVADLDQPEKTAEFADMFAQTLAYGLFSARVMDLTPGFDRREAQHLIPKTNPLLRRFFYEITGPQLDDEPYVSFVDDLAALLANTDMDAVLADFGKRTRQEDPVVHFYETFLAAYDPRLRESRGVYYTPEPVVSYIVRSVDHLLKTRFDCPQGLADTAKVTIRNVDPGLTVKGTNEMRKTTQSHKVLILDPAAGTGTFLYAVVDHIREQFMRGGNAGMWSGYVREHLLPRLFGFELLMAPYAVAHFKLALQLAGYDLSEAQRELWAYDFATGERIQVYLTNTLEGPHEYTGLPLLTQFLADETQAANEIKQDLPIMVVIGNPPYSGHSANKGEWIDGLLKGQLPDGEKVPSYYEVDGKPLGERNPKWLQDDYVKFIRFGQWRIERSGAGILAFITNHSYLDSPTFRGMRRQLMNTFTEIYLLDLHGNAKRQPYAPDGSPDQNVFDIQQGVAIGIFVKVPGRTEPAEIHHAELWGSRDNKYATLLREDIRETEWNALTPEPSFYMFVPHSVDLLAEHRGAWQITDVMPLHSMGVTTGRDAFATAHSSGELERRVAALRSDETNDGIRHKYGLKDSSSFTLKTARAWAKTPEAIDAVVPFSYRCFDQRFVIFSSLILARTRQEICKHQIAKKNLALITFRAIRRLPWLHVFVARYPVAKEYISSLDNCYVFPLYRYEGKPRQQVGQEQLLGAPHTPPSDEDRVSNLSPGFVVEFERRLGLSFCSEGIGDLQETLGPEDILHYIYAILNSPTYRERYVEFLRIDFPRVPITSDRALFTVLVEKGAELVGLHLLESPAVNQVITSYPVPGDNRIDRGHPRYIAPGQRAPARAEPLERGRVYINKTQYIEGVEPEIWEFQIGGYQVLHKWLKDRKGRELSFDDLFHYQKVVVALKETMRLMEEIDEVIEEHGGWPIE